MIPKEEYKDLDDLHAALMVLGKPFRIPEGADPIHYLGWAIAQLPAVHAPVVERFTPGLYSREITMFSGSIILSEKHLTEHQFVVLTGEVAVWTKENGMQYITAPYMGITTPGTQRVLLVRDTCRWATFHATSLTDPDEIRRTILEPHENPLLEFDPAERRRIAEEQYNLILSE